MSKVVLSLEFGGVVLPVAKDEEGRNVVPLKPISDLFGLDWKSQKIKTAGPGGRDTPPQVVEKGAKTSTSTVPQGGAGPEAVREMSEQEWLARRMGLCTVSVPWMGQRREMVCIRVDRVAAFLNTINPIKVHAAGNVRGAEYLARKQEEWDDLLHEYESTGGMISRAEHAAASARVQSIRAFVAVSKEKRSTSNPADRKALDGISAQLARDLGVPYQLELAPAAGPMAGPIAGQAA